jgi:hypothetical protein
VPDPDQPGTYRAPRVPATGIYAYTAATRFVAFTRLRPGVAPAELRFDTLGYADWALESYEVFKRLKSAGAVPNGALSGVPPLAAGRPSGTRPPRGGRAD